MKKQLHPQLRDELEDEVFNEPLPSKKNSALIAALKEVGFDVDEKTEFVSKGTFLAEPCFGFIDAWALHDARCVWEGDNPTQVKGEFLICHDPGTDNAVQIFEKIDGKWPLLEK